MQWRIMMKQADIGSTEKVGMIMMRHIRRGKYMIDLCALQGEVKQGDEEEKYGPKMTALIPCLDPDKEKLSKDDTKMMMRFTEN